MRRSTIVLALLVVAAAAVGVGALLMSEQDARDDAGEPAPHTGSGEGAAPTPAPVDGTGVGPAASLRGTEGGPASSSTSQPTVPPGARLVTVRGKVVGEDGQAVAGAGMEVVAGRASLGTTRTDPTGAFSLVVAVPPGPGGLWGQARAREGSRVGYAPVALRLDPRVLHLQWTDDDGIAEAGTIRLAAALGLDVLVGGSCRPASDARVTATSVDGFGFTGPTSVATADAEGRCRIDLLPAGTYRLVASAAGCGRGTAVGAVPSEDASPVRVELGPERVVEVEVVEAGTEAPIAGAVVTATEMFSAGPNSMTSGPLDLQVPIAPTDARGRTRVFGLGASDGLTFQVEAPGYGLPNAAERERGTRLRSGDFVRIALERRRRVEFPVVAGERPPPAEGTLLRLTHSPGTGRLDLPSAARMEGGRIVADDVAPGWVHALAVAPDGVIAALYAAEGKDVGNETSFRAPRTIEATLRYVDGTPAPGFWIVARNQGNNPMNAPVETDASGKARIEGLHGQLVEVYASETKSVFGGGIPIGTVDLEKGGGAVEATVERERRYLLTVRVDGVPKLPPQPRLRVGFLPVAVDQSDADAGTIRFRWRSPAKAAAAPSVTLEAAGFLPATAPLPPVEPPAEGVLTVDLLPAASVVLRVHGPAGGRYRVESHRWDETKQEWTFGGHDSNVMGMGQLRIDAAGVGRIASLEPGRYRFVDTTTGASTAPVEARAGVAVEVRLDLSASGTVRGRVLVPDGENARLARVERIGGERSLRPYPGDHGGGFVAEDGTFAMGVPGNVPVTLQVTHPVLAPADPDGRAVVTKPSEGVVLRLVAGRVAVLRVDRPIEGASSPPRMNATSVPVLLYRGEPRGEPAATLTALVEGTTLRFGGFSPGTYTLWIDPAPHAPVVVRGAVLGDGETDLGTLALSEGRKIVLKVLVKDGEAAPRTFLSAQRKDEPAYRRGANLSGADGAVTGLGPGVFRVTGGPIMSMGGGRQLDETVDLTVATEATVTLDLRGGQ